MKRKFVVHDSRDNVGIAIRDICAGEKIEGIFLDTRQKLVGEAKQPIPFGHKVALQDINANEKVLRYGECIGVATKPITRGEHVHVHNVQSIRC